MEGLFWKMASKRLILDCDASKPIAKILNINKFISELDLLYKFYIRARSFSAFLTLTDTSHIILLKN